MKPSLLNVVLFFSLLALFPIPQSNAQHNTLLPLFAEAHSDTLSTSTKEDTTIRSRNVHVVLELIENGEDPIFRFELNLFDDTRFIAVYERSEIIFNSKIAWIGHLEGIPLSQVVLIISENTLTGTISMPGSNYSIRVAANTIHTIEEVNHSKFPAELPPISLPLDKLYRQLQVFEIAGDDLCEEITVLVAYTPEARVAEGGTAAMEARISLAIAETNQSYINSGINNRISLVHAMETAAGDAANDFYTDLYALRNLNDNKFDSVDAARDLYHADLVALIIHNSSSCGLGFLNSTASSAFTVTHRSCATGYFSFGHELGHNMGARHDWYVDDELSYAKAYINSDDRWRTIMGYNNLCSDFGMSCNRIQHWSNPTKTYGGDPMGIASDGPMDCIQNLITPDPSTCAADNRTMLNNTCSNVANFRQAPTIEPDLVAYPLTVSDTTLTAGQSYTLSAIVGNTGGTVSNATTIQYYLSVDANITAADTLLGNDSLESLTPSATSNKSISLFAPKSAGTYYAGVCADSVAGEIVTNNNCSNGVQITVFTSTNPFPWALYLPSIINAEKN